MKEAKYRLFVVVVVFNRLFITIYYCFLQPQTKDSIVYPKYRAINLSYLLAASLHLISLLILIYTKIWLYFVTVCPSGYALCNS